MVAKTKKTKYGICKLNNAGYYYISSSPIKRFRGKPLHKIVYEEKHKCTVLYELGGIIHHKNGSKTDNRWWNLELMHKSKHSILHHTKNKTPWVMKKFEGTYDYEKEKYVFERIVNGDYFYLEHKNGEGLNKVVEVLREMLEENDPSLKKTEDISISKERTNRNTKEYYVYDVEESCRVLFDTRNEARKYARTQSPYYTVCRIYSGSPPKFKGYSVAHSQGVLKPIPERRKEIAERKEIQQRVEEFRIMRGI